MATLADVPAALGQVGAQPDFIEIRLKDVSRTLVLNRKMAAEAHPAIMRKYGVAQAQYLGE